MTIQSLKYFSLLVRQDDSIPLFEAALAIAQDVYPDLDLDAPQTEAMNAADVQARLPELRNAIDRLN